MVKSLNSLLSLQPLVVVLKKMIAEGKTGAKKLYEGLVREIESKPDLLKAMPDTSALEKDAELVETILSTIFPPSTSSNQGIYAITIPFNTETVYASPGFKEQFVKEGSNAVYFSDTKTGFDVTRSNLCLAYNLILKKFYSQKVSLTTNSIHAFKDANGLTRYFDLKLNAQFVDVKTINEEFILPKEFSPTSTLDIDELQELFPLQNFQFEGLVVVEVTDVTQEQVIVEIKTALISINSFSDVSIYDQLQQHVQSLISLKKCQNRHNTIF